MGKIKKEMTFEEIMKEYPETIEILFEHGMHCIGCSMAGMETLEQGAMAHGLDVDNIIKEMNAKIKNGK